MRCYPSSPAELYGAYRATIRPIWDDVSHELSQKLLQATRQIDLFDESLVVATFRPLEILNEHL